ENRTAAGLSQIGIYRSAGQKNVHLVLIAVAIDGQVETDVDIHDVQDTDTVDDVTCANGIEIPSEQHITGRITAKIERDRNRQSTEVLQLRDRAVQSQRQT